MAEGSGASPPGTSTARPSWGPRFRAIRQRAGRRIHKTHAITRISLAILVVSIGALAFGLTYSASIRDSVHWKFWLQVATSNWSPDQPKKKELTEQEKKEHKEPEDYIGDAEYAAGAVLALVVNLGSFVLVFGTLYQVWKAERNKAVETSDAYQFRDINLRQSVFWYILNHFAPALKEDHRATERAELVNGIQELFNESNQNLPADIRQGFGEAGEKFLKEHADDLIKAKAEAAAPGAAI